ncbi:MAG TPA: phosphoglycerate kinase [Ignavibacteria bacterium]|nr:phosphoglycerate kinase [Bacteroidota bacterium]HRE10163.1 phosphoglycerate kinase [Ignavibacteria bacterium]HRF65313.1 phosphoglycerate kinase [Ignavibacteria bacterium]HRJ03921.1 phosphoglycerate kinase [Ignavibacteria bacterium]
MNKLTIEDLSKNDGLKSKRVLVRVDFNVPMSKDDTPRITDDKRIVESLPTITKVIAGGGKLILMSHMGRPKGEKNMKYSLRPVAMHLSELLDKPVLFADDCIGESTEAIVNDLQDGDILLLENLRFYNEEEKNNPEFAKKLASYGDIYINDAFGTAHRAHASTEGVTHYIKTCAAGYLMQKELEYLSKAVAAPEHPYVAILGGSKISGKIDVIKNLLGKADKILVGGGMIFTFYKAMGYEIGNSLLEEDKIDLAKELIAEAGNKLILPVDVVTADKFENDAAFTTVDADKIPAGKIGMDIGAKTISLFKDEILKAKTVVWNGPMGVFEMDNFAKGTFEVAKALAEATKKGAITVIGGGDSAAAIAKAELENEVSHVSTGGGASLEFLEGKTLPGVEALNNN